MIRELVATSINGHIYLFPIPVIKERKYLILCHSQEEADLIAKAVSQQKLTHPDLLSDDFLLITLHTDKQTKVLSLNPSIDLPKLLLVGTDLE